MRRPPSLLQTVGSISAATGLSRILGLVRDQVQSFVFGAGAVTDAYVAAFRVPNLLRDLFAEGALSSAFVPTLTAVRTQGGAASGWRLTNRLVTALIAILLPLVVLIAVGAPWILTLYVPGFADETRALSVAMTRIVAPFLLFVALAAVAMGALNACGRFFLPALAPASFNLCSIAAVIALAPLLPRLGLHPGLALAVGALAGGALQLGAQLPALRREGFRFAPELAPRDPALRRVAALMAPATFGLAATQINILVDTILASPYEGAVTWLSLAFRLMQLPLGLFGVAIGTANLARVSADAARDDAAGLRRNVAGALRAAALLTLPATAGLIALREPIVRLLFEHGKFTADSTTKTAAAVLCYALGLYAYSLTKTQVPTFYALGETRTPVVASAVAVGAKIAANFALLAALPAFGQDAFLGLALSTSLAAWINFAWLARGLRRRIGSLAGQRVVGHAAKLALVALAVGLACGAAQRGLERALGGESLGFQALRLGGAIAAGLGVFVAGVALIDRAALRRLVRRERGAAEAEPPEGGR